MGRKKIINVKISEEERQKIIKMWLKNKADAFARGNWKEIARINKILAMYGYKPGKEEKEMEEAEMQA